MNTDFRWLLVLLANLLMIALVAEINHYLAIFSVHIFLGGLLLAFGVLRLRLRQGLIANGITALVLDSLNPLPFGQTFFLLLTCHTIVFSLRGHLPRENIRSGTLIAAGMNLAIFLTLTLLNIGGQLNNSSYWQRIFVDGTISTFALFLIAPWFLSLQKTALAFIGIDLDAEQREAQ
ncbi:MAG TPA: hypothetical protein VK041_04335 [Opitutales bacterium]|nr:hypothetical protein [Opitutales bacterium]